MRYERAQSKYFGLCSLVAGNLAGTEMKEAQPTNSLAALLLFSIDV
jgi:hypothetical protein